MKDELHRTVSCQSGLGGPGFTLEGSDLASSTMEKRHVGYDVVTYLDFTALTVYAASS